MQSFNRYAYANNNPYKYTDPDGRDGAALMAVDRDIFAMGRGEMTREEFMDRNEARGVGAAIGLGIVFTEVLAAEYITGGVLVRRELSREARRGIRSLEKRIKEHEEKIRKFKEELPVKPEMEKMSPEAIAKQQQRRIFLKEKEIQTLKDNIEKLKNPPPPPPPPKG